MGSNNLAAFYQHVKSKLGSSRGATPILVKGDLLLNDDKKANAFNVYFSSVFTPATKDSVVQVSISPMQPSCSDKINFSPQVTYEALRKANVSYSAGADEILSLFWKKLASCLALPVSALFTASFHFAVLPSEWKDAIVFPLFKKDDPSLTSNYRPIFLTSTLCKIMQSIVKDNIMAFALSNIIITSSQHGFMPHRSTCSQLLETHYEWCSGVDKGGIFDVITIDFRKAFDVVPPLKLLSKLSNLGVCEQTVLWLALFLPGRRQCLCVNNSISSHANISSSIIQGSVLGLLLFMFYINDLLSLCSDCVVQLFADDVKVYMQKIVMFCSLCFTK